MFDVGGFSCPEGLPANQTSPRLEQMMEILNFGKPMAIFLKFSLVFLKFLLNFTRVILHRMFLGTRGLELLT